MYVKLSHHHRHFNVSNLKSLSRWKFSPHKFRYFEEQRAEWMIKFRLRRKQKRDNRMFALTSST